VNLDGKMNCVLAGDRYFEREINEGILYIRSCINKFNVYLWPYQFDFPM
jgi:hypothetical protein